MIDVLMVVHRNYELLDLQINHWQQFEGEYRLLIVDNTPKNERKSTNYPILECPSFDGESRGKALDYLVKNAESDFIIIQDTDFFWLNKKIILDMEYWYRSGYQCVGAAGYYADWQRNIDQFPERKGSLAPVCYGMGIDRKLALKHTFVCTPQEGSQYLYTGWRVRQDIIHSKTPNLVFEGHDGDDCCLFSDDYQLQGLHLLKGSAGRQYLTSKIPELLEKYS